MSFNLFAQKSNYIIITILKESNSKLDGYGETQWLIPEDSLKNLVFNYSSITPLFISDYSYDMIAQCKNNIPVDPFTFTTETSFSFPDSVSQNIEQMNKLISKNKKLIQTIKKKWETGYKEKVKIYATPVIGDFCKCKFENFSKVEFDTTKQIFIGFNKFYQQNQFWNSKSSNELKSIDFSLKYNFHRMWH